MDREPRDYTVNELAALDGCDPGYIRRLLIEHRLNGAHRGRQWFVLNDERLREWLKREHRRTKPK